MAQNCLKKVSDRSAISQITMHNFVKYFCILWDTKRINHMAHGKFSTSYAPRTSISGQLRQDCILFLHRKFFTSVLSQRFFAISTSSASGVMPRIFKSSNTIFMVSVANRRLSEQNFTVIIIMNIENVTCAFVFEFYRKYYCSRTVFLS